MTCQGPGGLAGDPTGQGEGRSERRAGIEEERGGDAVYCTRVTVTSRQFVTQEVESENVTLNLRLGGGVEGREECKATVRIPQPRRDSERRKKGRKRRAAQPAQVHQHLHQHMQSAPAPAVNTVQCPLYSVHCSVYTVNCGLFTVHCILYTVQCTLYTVHCTLYTVKCTPAQVKRLC